MSSDGNVLDEGRPQSFAALQSALDSKRRARPPPIHISLEDMEKTRVSLRQPQIQRRESKGGLRGIFTRNKQDKLDKPMASPVAEEAASTRGIADKAIKGIAESSLRHSISSKRAVTTETISVPPTTPSKPVNRPSRMNLRSKSVKQPKNKSPKSTRSITKSTSKAAWDPPPLFQAYPQAIKHAQLSASTMSADSILRISNHKRNGSIRDEFAQLAASEGAEQGVTAKKTEMPKFKHKRQLSGSISKADWTQKIFVLVTSGYLLQYSGFGSFDRLPEKMLQLGKDSVAFASDVIPGKHWVLQVSQAMDPDGTPAADPRSLLSRLTFRGVDYRRTATSLLLVLDSAGEMDSWISVLRREIEALGGKKNVSETGKPKPDDKVMQLKAQPSHRYLIQKDPEQFPDSGATQAPFVGPPPWSKEKSNESHEISEDSTTQFTRPQSCNIRPSTGRHSVTISIASSDTRQVDSSRDSQNRFSYMSSGQRTLLTSRSSSPMVSPSRETFDEVPFKNSIDDVRLRPNAAAINERRRSMQTTYISIIQASEDHVKKHRHSTHGALSRPTRSHSPAPNFSVPISSNKRYSTIKSPGLEHTPPVPNKPTVRRDHSQKGSRKSPPTATNSTRPLSPVKDSSSPKRNIKLPTKSEEDLHDIIKPPISTTTHNSAPVGQGLRVEIPAPAEEAVAQLDFQFPRKFASMQVLRNDSFTYLPDAPLRPAPAPPVERTSPDPVEEENQNIDPNLEEEAESLPALISTPPISTKKKSKFARPVSLSTSSSPPPTNLSSPAPERPSENAAVLSVNPTPLPALKRVKDIDAKALGNRRSMPVLMNGPPPAPPPNCALPPLPPPNTDRKLMMTPVKV